MADIGAAVAALDAICPQLDNALVNVGKPLRTKADLRRRHCKNVDAIQRCTRIAASEALSRCVGSDGVKAMLEDPRHSLWGKEDLPEAVQEVCGTQQDVYRQEIHMIFSCACILAELLSINIEDVGSALRWNKYSQLLICCRP